MTDPIDTQFEIVSYIIGSLDMILFIISLTLLMRLLRHERLDNATNSPNLDRAPKRKKLKVERKYFYAIIMLAMLIRGTFLLSHPFYVKNIPYPPLLFNIYSQLAAYFFIVAYLCLLLYWKDFFYLVNGTQPSEEFHRMFRVFTVTFLGVVILVLLSFAVLYIVLYAIVYGSHHRTVMDHYQDVIACIIAAVVSLFALLIAGGFFYYGIRIYLVLRHSSILSGAKRPQAMKIFFVVGGCTVCFVTRATIDLYTIYDTLATLSTEANSQQWSGPPMLLFAFYFCTETLPGSLMLWLLRKLPKEGENRPLIQ